MKCAIFAQTDQRPQLPLSSVSRESDRTIQIKEHQLQSQTALHQQQCQRPGSRKSNEDDLPSYQPISAQEPELPMISQESSDYDSPESSYEHN